MKRLPLIMLMIVVLHDVHAEGPIHRTSFEELVRDATDIIVGSVLSTSKTGDNLRFQREYTLRILRIIKGAETNAVITIHQENFYPAVNVNPEQGQNYVVFLHHAPGDNKYQHQLATSVTLSVFLDAIKREMCRTLKPLPREFLGIRMGESIQKAEASSGLHFIHYNDTNDKGTNWNRYHTFMPRNSEEHMVQINAYKGSIIHLSVYYLKENHDYLKILLQEMEAKCGGTPLDEMGDLSFAMGRRWTDANVDITFTGPITFVKENGFPWGVFSAYELSVTDKTVLEKRLRDMGKLKEN